MGRLRSIIAVLILVLSCIGVVHNQTVAQVLSQTVSPLVWQPCVDVPERDCATMTVPLDYAHPSAGTVNVPVARQRATDTTQPVLGTIFYNNGGPGNRMASIVRYNDMSNRIPSAVMARYNVVGVNPRLTGQNDQDFGVTCNSSADLTAYWTTNRLPRNYAERQTLLNQEEAFNKGCVGNNLPLSKFGGTANSIRDMESVRQAMALGGDATADKVTLIGYSYGTFIMHRYASLYPGHVRLAYLDSMVSRKTSDVLTISESHIAFDKSWDVFKRWCDNTADCALHGQNLDQIFDAAMARARTGSGIPAPNGLITQEPANDWVLSLALEATTVAGQENFAWTADMLVKATTGPTGDASLARFLYDVLTGRSFDGTYDPEGAGTHRAIACLDYDFSQWLNRPAKVKLFEAATDFAAPRFGRASLYQGAAQCYKYPVPPIEPAPLKSPVPASIPVLIVSATEDASTPLGWAERAASEMKNASLLVRDGDGHLNYRFSACVRAYAETFLLTGQRPANNTHCASDPVDVIPPPFLGLASTQSQSTMPTASDLRDRLQSYHP